MASCSSSTLTTLSSVALSKDYYDTPVAKLELCLSTLHTWFCYNGLALNPDKSDAIVFDTTQSDPSAATAVRPLPRQVRRLDDERRLPPATGGETVRVALPFHL